MLTMSDQSVSAVKIERDFALPGVAFCTARVSDSQILFGASDFNVYRVDTQAEKPAAEKLSEPRHNSYVTGIVHHSGTAVSGSYDGSIILWETDSGEQKTRVEKAHERGIRQLVISPDGSTVASVGDDMQTKLWETGTGKLLAEYGDYDLKTPHGYPSMLYAVAWSPDGQWLATGNRTGHVFVRKAETGEIAARLETPVMYTWDPKARRHSIGGIRSLAFSRDSTQLAVGGIGKIGNIDHLAGPSRIEVFNWQAEERIYEIEDNKFKGLVECMAYGPDDAWLAAAGGDHGGFVSLYDMTSGKLLAQEKAPMHVHDFVVSEDGARIDAVGHEKACVVSIS